MIKVNRIPSDDVYNIFLTFIMGLTFLIVVYAIVPANHCSIYFLKNSSN